MRLNQADDFLWEVLVSASNHNKIAKFLIRAQSKAQAEFKLKEKDFFTAWVKGRPDHQIVVIKRYRGLGSTPKEGLAA